MVPAPSLTAWRPDVPGVAEVLHAHFPEHAYPSHTHDTWTLMLVDSGTVAYGLDHGEHATDRARVTLLPPHVPHDGRSVTDGGFRKRVVYLEAGALDVARVGRVVDEPDWPDPLLHAEVHALHGALLHPGDGFEAEERLALVLERLERHLARRPPDPGRRDPGVAHRLRDLLDARVVEGLTLSRAAEEVGAHPTHLVRAFTREVGIAPHRYLTGRRLDRARRLLLEGRPPSEVAAEVGFHDQAHLTRHFKRLLGVTPGAYARSA